MVFLETSFANLFDLPYQHKRREGCDYVLFSSFQVFLVFPFFDLMLFICWKFLNNREIFESVTVFSFESLSSSIGTCCAAIKRLFATILGLDVNYNRSINLMYQRKIYFLKFLRLSAQIIFLHQKAASYYNETTF